MTAATPLSPSAIPHCKIAILGTGFSGLGMAIRLKQAGENDFLLLEKEAGVGGTWRVNHYPGCACDVQSHLYSFSFAPNPEWSRMFAPQPEIKRYLEDCWERFGLAPHTQLNTELSRLSWNESSQHWLIETRDGKQFSARFVVSGMGGLSTPAFPSIKGLKTFKGKLFHSQQWDHDYDLSGKRVAVIGTGASAIQFVPQIQPRVGQLDLYQRTPPWIMPKPDRAISERERRLFRRHPALQKLWRGGIYSFLEARVLGFAISPQILRLASLVARHHLRKQIRDPELRRKLTPDYVMGCKRVLISNDYYPALTQPNVSLITDGVAEVRAHSIVTQDGQERTVDAIILGTGFTPADPIPRGLISGRNGVDLVDSWPRGPEAYKGTTTAGFPNLFFLMGPNTGLGHSSMVYMIESQIQYVMSALQLLDERALDTVEVKREAQERFNRKIDQTSARTVWQSGGCASWYLHPQSGRNCTVWPGFTWRFRQITRHFDPAAYHFSRQPAAEEVLETEPEQQEARA